MTDETKTSGKGGQGDGEAMTSGLAALGELREPVANALFRFQNAGQTDAWLNAQFALRKRIWCQMADACLAVIKPTLDAQEKERLGVVAQTEQLRAGFVWLYSGDTGVSSETILLRALGIKPPKRLSEHWPLDKWDRGRCIRLLQSLPWAIRGLAELEQESDGWRGQAKLIREALAGKGGGG